MAISEFPKGRKYLISLSFLGKLSVRPAQVVRFDVNIVIHGSTAVRGRGDLVAYGWALWKLPAPWTHRTRPPHLGKRYAFSTSFHRAFPIKSSTKNPERPPNSRCHPRCLVGGSSLVLCHRGEITHFIAIAYSFSCKRFPSSYPSFAIRCPRALKTLCGRIEIVDRRDYQALISAAVHHRHDHRCHPTTIARQPITGTHGRRTEAQWIRTAGHDVFSIALTASVSRVSHGPRPGAP